MITVLVVILILMVFGLIPDASWPHYPHQYGVFPSGALGIIVLILLVLILTGRLR